MLTTGSPSTSWTAEEDYTLVACHATNTSAAVLVSRDPSDSVLTTSTPTAVRRSWDVIFSQNAGVNREWPARAQIPISKGETLLVMIATAATTVQLWLEPAETIAT